MSAKRGHLIPFAPFPPNCLQVRGNCPLSPDSAAYDPKPPSAALLGMGPYLAYGPEYLNPALPSAVLNLQNFGTFSFDRPWNHNLNRMIPG